VGVFVLSVVVPVVTASAIAYLYFDITHAIHRSWKAVALFVGVVVALLLPIWLRAYPAASDPNTHPFWFVVQTLAGDWSPNRPTSLPTYGFSLLAEMAVFLNLGSFVVVLNLLLKLGRIDMGSVMKLGELYKVRDLSIRNSVLARLDPTERERFRMLLDAAFAEGDQAWRDDHLKTILGEEEAQKMQRLLAKGTLHGTKIKAD
jgi:hypothetical protein